MFSQLARTTLRILLFQQGPQDFPYAREAVRIVLPFAVLANYLQLQLTMAPVPALLMSLVELFALLIAVLALLNLRGLVNRLQQTMNTLYATNAVFTLALLPLVAQLAPILQAAAENPQMFDASMIPAWVRWGMVLLSFWNLAVMAHVLRHALDFGIGLGIAVALLCTVFVYGVVQAASQLVV